MAARHAPKLSGPARAAALRRVLSGERPLTRIADDYGTSVRRLRAAAQDAGIPSRFLSAAQRREVVARYRAGEVSGSIAASYGITQRRVQQLALAAGCSRPRGGSRPRKDPLEQWDA